MEVPGVSVERFGKFDVLIRYSIDGKGPYELRMPKEGFSPTSAEAAVREAVRERLSIEGREIQV
jgi:hypothetical protein